MRGINSSWLLDIDQRSTDRLNWEDLPLGLWRGPETGPPRAHSYLTQLMSKTYYRRILSHQTFLSLTFLHT